MLADRLELLPRGIELRRPQLGGPCLGLAANRFTRVAMAGFDLRHLLLQAALHARPDRVDRVTKLVV